MMTLNEFVVSQGWSSRGLKGGVELPLQRMLEVQKHLGVNPQDGRPWFVIFDQMPGDMVHIPAGWGHAVCNRQVKYMYQNFLTCALYFS
jgi:hypothetical protein